MPIARIVPLEKSAANKTMLGCGRDTGRLVGDITEPLIPENNWEMLGKGKT